MKSNFIHVCFVIDQSGSMDSSKSDVEGGVKKVITDQKAIKDGTCAISLFTFESVVKEEFIGKDINDVEEYKFNTGGLTAMNDGIGTAIDRIGEWLSAMPEEERPEKNLIVIITDGYENASTKYSLDKVKEMIKHQEEKYSWTFMYLGTDITSTEQADSLGILNQGYSIRGKMSNSYDMISTINSVYRTTIGDASVKNAAFCYSMSSNLNEMNKEYAEDTGINITTSVNND